MPPLVWRYNGTSMETLHLGLSSIMITSLRGRRSWPVAVLAVCLRVHALWFPVLQLFLLDLYIVFLGVICAINVGCFYFYFLFISMSRLETKPTKWHVRPAKTQISLGIRPV